MGKEEGENSRCYCSWEEDIKVDGRAKHKLHYMIKFKLF